MILIIDLIFFLPSLLYYVIMDCSKSVRMRAACDEVVYQA